MCMGRGEKWGDVLSGGKVECNVVMSSVSTSQYFLSFGVCGGY